MLFPLKNLISQMCLSRVYDITTNHVPSSHKATFVIPTKCQVQFEPKTLIYCNLWFSKSYQVEIHFLENSPSERNHENLI